jgi:hypothetical protein
MQIRFALMLFAAGLVAETGSALSAMAETRPGEQPARVSAPAAALRQSAAGLVTAKLHDVPLAAVLDDIAKQNALRIFISARVDKRVTVDFRGLPLEEGLRRILRGTNFAFFYARGDRNRASLKLIGVDVLPATENREYGDAASATPLARRIFQANDGRLRAEAAKALAQSRDPSALGALAQALAEDGDQSVRAAAAEALGKSWSEVAVAPLSDALQDPSADVREAAARALGKTWSDAATEPLLAALAYDRDPIVREQAALALGATSGGEAVDALTRALEDRRWYVRDAAADALEAIGTLEAVNAARQFSSRQ